MSRARPSSRSRTNSALRSSSAIVAIRSFAALSEASSCCSALSSASSRSIVTSRSSSEYSTPQRAPRRSAAPASGGTWGLLSLCCSGGGLTPSLLLLGRLVDFFSPPEGEQLPAQAVALPFGLFAPAALLVHPFAQCGLRHLPASPFVVELFPSLLRRGVGLYPLRRLLDRLDVLWGLLRRRRGELSHGYGLLRNYLLL